MVMKPRLIGAIAIAAALSGACTVESARERRIRDLEVGIIENSSYRFVAEEGLLHLTGSTDTTLAARATAAEFTARISRKRPDLASVTLRIGNLPDNASLRIAGVDTPGAAAPGLAHTFDWTISFPVGVDEIEIAAPSLAGQDFRFLAFGDIQGGIDRFGDMVDAVNQEPTAEFILMLGDLTSNATGEQFDEVQSHFANIRMPVYSTPGNHDAFRKREYQDYFGRASYSFTHRGVRFTSVDSASAELDAEVWDWARAWMTQGRSATHVVFTHIPAVEASGIRSGQWNSRREAARFVALARQHAVDLLLFGHIHSYDAYELAGIPTYISGGCGAIEEKLDGIDRHYLRIDYMAATGSLRVEPVEIE